MVERGSLFGIHPAVAAGVQGGGALAGRDVAKLAEGARDGAALVGGQGAELLHGSAELLALRGVEALHQLDMRELALPLAGRHGIELGEMVVHALLGLPGQIAEAGLAVERLLLLIGRQVAVLVHPLGEMFAALAVELRIAALDGVELGAGLLVLPRSGGGRRRATFYRRGRLTRLRRGLAHRHMRRTWLAKLTKWVRALMMILRMQRRSSGDAQDRRDRKDEDEGDGGVCAASWSVALHRNSFQGPIISKPPSSLDRGGGFVATFKSTVQSYVLGWLPLSSLLSIS
jgi:hypothetical protein